MEKTVKFLTKRFLRLELEMVGHVSRLFYHLSLRRPGGRCGLRRAAKNRPFARVFLVLPRRRVVLDTFSGRFCSLLKTPRGTFGFGFEDKCLHLVTDTARHDWSRGFERCPFNAKRSRRTFGAGEDQGYSLVEANLAGRVGSGHGDLAQPVRF